MDSHCSCHRAIRLKAETIAKLRAVAESMGLTVDDLGEQIIVDMLPTVQHEDLLTQATRGIS